MNKGTHQGIKMTCPAIPCSATVPLICTVPAWPDVTFLCLGGSLCSCHHAIIHVVLGLDFGVVLGLDFAFAFVVVLGFTLGLDLGGIWSKGNKKLTRSSAASWAWCLGPAARVEVVSSR